MANQFHTDIEGICGDRVGVGVRYDYLAGLLADALVRYANSPILSHGLGVLGTKVGVGVTVVRATPFFDAPGGRVRFGTLSSGGGLSFDLNIHDRRNPSRVIRTLRLDYDDLAYKVLLVANRLLLDPASQVEPNVVSGELSEDLIADPDLFNGGRNEYALLEFAIKSQAIGLLPSAFGRFFPTPDLLNALGALRVEGDLAVTFTAEALFITGTTLAVGPLGGCPPGGSAEDQTTISLPSPLPAEGPIDLTVVHKTPGYEPGGTPQRSPVLFYVTERKLKGVSFDIVKPAAVVNDGGEAFLVYWNYHAGVALREGSLSLTVTPNRVAIGVRLSLDVFGNASAGITIACIRHEVLGAGIRGVIDLEIDLEPRLEGNRLILYSVLRNNSVNIDVDGRGVFPLNVIADLVLDGVANKAVKAAIDKSLNALRLPLLNLPALRVKLPARGSNGSTTDDSALYGIVPA